MSDRVAISKNPRPAMRALSVVLPLAIAAAVLSLYNLSHLLPPNEWSSALFSPSEADIGQLVAHETFFPRVVLSLMAGAGLAVVGLAHWLTAFSVSAP